jgi:flagellar motility protein MotE (MotC chaperone)
MVEYTVETLVHLYDSLNGQIENVQSDLNDFMRVDFDPNLRDEVRAEIEAAHTKTEKRLEKLISMRDDVEELLNKILKAEVAE